METIRELYTRENAAEYGDKYGDFIFISESEAAQGERDRQALLLEISRTGGFSCGKGSKIHSGGLSPGCKCCMEGTWSCLFINNICNAGCFYCPTPQKSKSEPDTNNLNFPRSQDYLDYLGVFGFRGVGISGGEPFMTYDRTLSYVSKIKKRFGGAVHLWLYTNGILATGDKIAALADGGLDEIRFDISAVDYSLDKAAMASRIVPTTTVEIPAVPEDYTRLRDLLPRMEEAGVNHLNLHQLRCTPHNRAKLTARGYRFTHGPRVLVYESELMALRILRDSLEKGRGPSINYCSFAYKSRFQALAARRRAAERLTHPHEEITEAGYIRSITLRGPVAVLDLKVVKLKDCDSPGQQWRREGPERLALNCNALQVAGVDGVILQTGYSDSIICEHASLRGGLKKIMLNRGRTIVAERRFVESFLMETPEQSSAFLRLLAGEKETAELPGGHLSACVGYERLSEGLFPYS